MARKNPKDTLNDNKNKAKANANDASTGFSQSAQSEANETAHSDNATQQEILKTLKSISRASTTTNQTLKLLSQIAANQRQQLEANTRGLNNLTDILRKEKKSKEQQDKAKEEKQKEKDQKDKEKKDQDDISKRTTTLRQLNHMISSLSKMDVSPFDTSIKKDLTREAKDLRKRAIAGEDVSGEYKKLRFEEAKLESSRDSYDQSFIGSAIKSISSTDKLRGGAATVMGALTGINPVFLQLFGLDKLGKWAGKKAFNGLASLTKSAFTPIDWKSFKKEKVEASTDKDGDGISNGTETLKDKKDTTQEELKAHVENIDNKLNNKGDDKGKVEKEEEGGTLSKILSGVMKVISTVVGLAASGAMAVIALAGKGIVEKLISKVFEIVGVSKETADALAGPIAGLLPGAIVGFKLGGFKGAIVGALISGGFFAVKKQIGQITSLLNGEVVPDAEINTLGDALNGAIIGGALGIPAGPSGILVGALIGALGGVFLSMWKKMRNDSNKAYEREEEQLAKAAEKGITYSGEEANAKADEQIDNIKNYLEKNPNSGLADTAEDMIEDHEKRQKLANKYEKIRADAQKEALEKYGTSDLSKLNLDQLEDLMDDDDAEFEAYLNELQGKGYITNDAATRKSLRKIWKDNENWTWGENVNSKRAVHTAVSNLVSQKMPTSQEIIADGNAEAARKENKQMQQSINNLAQSNNGPTNNTNVTMHQSVTNVTEKAPVGIQQH